MSITFYYAPMSSATPVAWALAELGVEHKAVKFDLKATEHKKPEFLALNPNGKVPTIVVDGTPMFEAVAIMQWLGDRYGVEKGLWPAMNDPARLTALSWSTWVYVSFGCAIRQLSMATHPKLGNAAQAEYCRKETDDLVTLLDARFTQKPYLLSDRFSLADLIVAGAVGYGSRVGVSLAGHPNVQSWLQRCQDRSAFRSVLG